MSDRNQTQDHFLPRIMIRFAKDRRRFLLAAFFIGLVKIVRKMNRDFLVILKSNQKC